MPRRGRRALALAPLAVAVTLLQLAPTDGAPPTCRGRTATVAGTIGTEGDDVIIGTTADETIEGLGGDDLLCGGGGADTILGGPGNDTIWGDTRKGPDAGDRLEGGDGDDLLVGASGDDVLIGGLGNDTIDDHGGNDVISGGPGDDHLFGDAGDDVVFGGEGRDGLGGGPGADVLLGGDGDDVFVGDASTFAEGRNGSDLVVGGRGADQMWGSNGTDPVVGHLVGFDADTCVVDDSGDTPQVEGVQSCEIVLGPSDVDLSAYVDPWVPETAPATSFDAAVLAVAPDGPLAGGGIMTGGDVVLGQTGTSTVTHSTDVGGDLVVRGALVLQGSAVVHGDVRAGGDVYIREGARVLGDVVAGGSIVIEGSGHVVGDARAAGTVTVPGPWAVFVEGATVGGDTTIVVPSAPTLPAPPGSFDGAGWPAPFRTVTCAAFEEAHNPFWPTEPAQGNRSAFAGTWFVTGDCTVDIGAGSHALTLAGDAAIVAEGCIDLRSSARFERPAASTATLRLISLRTAADGCAGINVSSTYGLSTVPTFVYSAGRMVLPDGGVVRGQVVADRLQLPMSLTVQHEQVPVWGFA